MGASLAIDHLVSRGRKKIVMLNGEPQYEAARERAAGAQEALARHGLNLVTNEVLYGSWNEA
ncbi:substrate-binding domain-containing protein [Arthrobacter sp. ISL-30]|nr:substrate-binding domain-containing protein [Arthrobacter sp. ISL-30]